MSNSLFTDDSIRAAKLALDGLSSRQQAISRNLANVDTPGYRAQSVDFESALKQVFNKQSSLNLQTTRTGHMAAPAQTASFRLVDRPGGSFRADQNNVDIDVELTDMSETGIQYQAVAESLIKKLQLLKTIASR
jgi:flagellar basal-body rod protein FlgB